MKTTTIIRGIITGIMLLMAMKWGEKHPPKERGMVVVKVDVDHMRAFEPENNSTFTVNRAVAKCEFVFPRDTMLYTIQFCARPSASTPNDVFTNIDNIVMDPNR